MRVVGRMEMTGLPAESITVRLIGDHDLSTAPELRALLGKAIADGPRIVVDLGETTFLDSSILHALIDASLELGCRNGPPGERAQRLGLRFGSALAVRHVFEVAGVLDRFDLVES